MITNSPLSRVNKHSQQSALQSILNTAYPAIPKGQSQLYPTKPPPLLQPCTSPHLLTTPSQDTTSKSQRQILLYMTKTCHNDLLLFYHTHNTYYTHGNTSTNITSPDHSTSNPIFPPQTNSTSLSLTIFLSYS